MNLLTFIKDNVGSYSGIIIGVMLLGFVLPYLYSVFEWNTTIAQVVKWGVIISYGGLVVLSFYLKKVYDQKS